MLDSELMLNPECVFNVDVKNYPLRVKAMVNMINGIMQGAKGNSIYIKTLAYGLIIKIVDSNQDLAIFLDLCAEDLNEAPF